MAIALIKMFQEQIYIMLTEHSDYEVFVLEAGKMNKCKSLSDFEKGQTVITHEKIRVSPNSKSCGVFLVYVVTT